MPVPCALCNKTEFSLVFESHHPIEKQPVVICYPCFRATIHFMRDNDELFSAVSLDTISNYVQSREAMQPKRCDK